MKISERIKKFSDILEWMLTYLYRNLSFAFLSIILALVLFSPQPASAYLVSGSYTNLSNQSVSYSSYGGTFLFVEVFQTGCGACKTQHEHLQNFYNDFNDRVKMVSISLNLEEDTIEVINDYLKTYVSPWDVGIDTGRTFTNQFSVTATPTMILFDWEGRELITKVGVTQYSELASNMNYYLSVSNPGDAPKPTYEGGSGDSGSVIEDLFSSPIFSIGFFSVIVIMLYVKMTGGTSKGV